MKIKQGSFMNYVVIPVFAVWLFIACRALFVKADKTGKDVAKFWNKSSELKREGIYGEFYRFISRCDRRIPENASVLLVTNDLYYYYYASYYLYPRRVLVNSPEKRVDWFTRDNLALNVNDEFIKANDISYVLRIKNGDYALTEAKTMHGVENGMN